MGYTRQKYYGVGICEIGEYPITICRKATKEHSLWNHMLYRCYDKDQHLKNPSYVGCTVSENFKEFQYFARWCQSQTGFNKDGWHLDKDILGDGKLYSEGTCAFIPAQLNLLLIQRHSARGLYPIGVYFDKLKLKYRAQSRVGGINTHLGYFSNVEEAFLAYKKSKEGEVKLVAEKYKDSVDPRVYDELLVWEVSILD